MTDFTTKDSGERQSYASGMQRDTERGKPRFDLLMPKGVPFEAQMLTRFAALMARGAEKYDARNWEKADSSDELERYHSSAFRHFMQWVAGETDEDHAAAVMFNLLAAETLKYKLAQEETKLKAMQDAINRMALRVAAESGVPPELLGAEEDDGPSCCDDEEDPFGPWPEGWSDLGAGRIYWAPLGTAEPEPSRTKTLLEPLRYEFDNETRAWRVV